MKKDQNKSPQKILVLGGNNRMFQHYGRNRPDLIPGCPERYDYEFLQYVATFRRLKLSAVFESLQQYQVTTASVILHDDEEADRYLQNFPFERELHEA